MFYVSEIYTNDPKEFRNDLQEKVYKSLGELNIDFERVDTDEAITMEDCIEISNRLNIKMVKTLFLCNRQKTDFYLFITVGDKKFDSKKFSQEMDIARVSFAPIEFFEGMLGTKIGAATVYSALIDNNKIQIVFDKEVIKEEFYGCSDGTTTGDMKVKTEDIINKFLPYTKHSKKIIEM